MRIYLTTDCCIGRRLIGKLSRLMCVVLLSIISIASLAENRANVTTLQPVTVQLKWKHQFQFAGFYAALEKGIYRNAGFDVTLKAATYDTDPIDEVLSGRADYGVANAELALYRLQGEPVVALAVIIQHSPIVLMTLEKSKIFSPQDLIGKKLMYPEGHYGANTLGIMAKEGVSKEQFESVPLSFNINDLIDGNVDAMVGYVTDQPYLLDQKNVSYKLMDPRNYGIDFYGDTLFASEKLVNRDPASVERFREASMAGWRYAVEHPEEVIEWLMTKYKSEKNRDELRYESVETIKLIVPKLVEIGHMNPGRWRHIADTFLELGMAPRIETPAKVDVRLDEFLFNPVRERSKQPLKLLFSWMVVCLVVFLVATALLVVFNRRLKRIVENKTNDLTEKNKALEASAQQLTENQEALSQLNSELEARIDERTQALNAANQLLIDEIEARKRKELSVELLHKAIDCSHSAVLVIDKSHVIRYASSASSIFTGFNAEMLLDKPAAVLDKNIHLPDISLDELLEMDKFEMFSEVESVTQSGLVRWLQISVSPMKIEGETVSHYIVVCEDISELKSSKDKLGAVAIWQ